MGTPRLGLCGSSTEQILQTVHSPAGLSLLRHIVCALAFHSAVEEEEWGGGRRLLSEPLSKQCGEKKGACHLYSVPRRTCLFFFFLSLFELQAVELSREFDVRKAELIALSQRGGPPITRTLPAMLYGDY